MRPVESATSESPAAFATSIDVLIVAVQASEDTGFTMPVVPSMEIPPVMPSLLFSVCMASLSPSGTEIVIFILPESVIPPRPSASANASCAACPIIILGTGFMAGSPTLTGRPGLVTVPTPEPPVILIMSRPLSF